MSADSLGTVPIAAEATGPLRGQDLTVVRGGRHLLDGVGMTAEAGTITAVTGASGAGKTTLLWVLAGLLEPDRGSVGWGGRPLPEAFGAPSGRSRARNGARGRLGVGVVLQEFGLLPALTAQENVELVLQLAGQDRAGIPGRALAALREAGLGPDEFKADRLVAEMSGGQMQRVALARALVTEPNLIIADEPTSELHAANRDLVVALLRQRAEAGAVVVLATHDPEVTAACDHEVHLVDGRRVPPPEPATATG